MRIKFLGIFPVLFFMGCSSLSTEESANQTTHRTIENLIQDENNEAKALQALFKNNELWQNSSIEVVSFNNTFLLVGQTPTHSLKQQAENLVRQIESVKRIYNEIRVAAPTSSLTYINDVALTSKVKAAMMLDDSLPSDKIKVITEDSEVFLLGLVSKEQATKAIDISRNVSGVKKVIQAFEITP